MLDCLRLITEHTPAFMTPSLPENQSQHGKAVLTEKPEATDGKEIDQETEEWTGLPCIAQKSCLTLELFMIIVARSSPDSKSAPALQRLVRGRRPEQPVQNLKSAVAPVYKFWRFG